MSSRFAATAAMVPMGDVLAKAVSSLKRKRSSLDLGAVMEEPASTDEADTHVSEPSTHEKPCKTDPLPLPIRQTVEEDDSPWELVDPEIGDNTNVVQGAPSLDS